MSARRDRVDGVARSDATRTVKVTRALVPAFIAFAVPIEAQSVLDRPPNFLGTWTGPPGTVHFNFLHRFRSSESSDRKVTSSPTFLVAAGLPWHVLAGFQYATNSQLVAGYPNEWEFFARVAPLAMERGAPIDASVHTAYNLAAQSVDGELTLARAQGRVRLLAAARVLSNAFDAGEVRYAAAGGATVRLNRYIALAGDVASLIDREDGEEVAWSAGVQLALPNTPHTLSLHASNTLTSTVQGASLGTDLVRYGFEFTIPITLSRYFGRRAPPTVATPSDVGPQARDTTAARGATIDATIRRMAYAEPRLEISAGTTIRWKNEDQVPHTVTADDGSWNSGLIAPGATWSRTFDEAGSFGYHCTPHPFMKGAVVVR
ncbi:MAG TPA: cupredoxin family copper-binding protein [Gemmatimonadaceae bacterium]|nr:cupredoxin family copper-binding protein [Gemmatimonadaceae bacterium]